MRNTFALLLVLPLSASVSSAATTSEYGPKDKLSRGVANITTGVLAFPGTIADKTQEDGAKGVPVGIGMGLVNMVGRELVGVYDLVTFPLPQPHDYAPVMEPSYPWQYFTESREVREARARHDRLAERPRGTEAAHEAHVATPPSDSRRDLTANDVRDVQSRLMDMGYHPGPADGVMGPRTRSALRAFQKDKGLQTTGRLDDATLAAMNAASARRGESPVAGTASRRLAPEHETTYDR